MLPHNLRAIAQDVGDLLEAGAAAQEFRGERMPESVGVSTLYAGFFEHQAQDLVNAGLERVWLADAAPEKYRESMFPLGGGTASSANFIDGRRRFGL